MFALDAWGTIPKPESKLVANAVVTHDVMVSGTVVLITAVPLTLMNS